MRLNGRKLASGRGRQGAVVRMDPKVLPGRPGQGWWSQQCSNEWCVCVGRRVLHSQRHMQTSSCALSLQDSCCGITRDAAQELLCWGSPYSVGSQGSGSRSSLTRSTHTDAISSHCPPCPARRASYRRCCTCCSDRRGRATWAWVAAKSQNRSGDAAQSSGIHPIPRAARSLRHRRTRCCVRPGGHTRISNLHPARESMSLKACIL